MGQRQQDAIRAVRYTPPSGVTGEIEIISLAIMRERSGAGEFLAPQRLDFDLLIRIDSGSTVHTVDFIEYPLAPGDLLWVRAGQVQQWGAIDDIDGPVVLFTPAATDTETRERIRSAGVATPNHWPASTLDRSPATATLDALLATAESSNPLPDNEIRDPARAHLLAAALLLLVMTGPPGADRNRLPTQQAFIWFRDELESSFRTRHKVVEYAARLGYSTKTLNRLSRDNTGLSAKQLIDDRIVLEAKRLLAHSRDPVAHIADDLGFDDPSNFSKYFQQRTDSTPAEFRRRARDSAPLSSIGNN